MQHIYNLRRDPHPEQDRCFVPRIAVEELPQSVDLRSQMPPVYDQGKYGSCTANAGAADWDWIFRSEGGQFINPSRFYIYFNERQIDGTSLTEDAGSTGRTLMGALTQFGVCPEEMWEYTDVNFSMRPTPECYAYGSDHQALKHERVAQSKLAIMSALAQQVALCTGIAVYESFEGANVAKTGIVPMPKRFEKLLGGHEVLAVGYDADHVFFRNSWGAEWGVAGYFALPWSYVLSPKLTFDFWALQKVEIGK